MKKYYIYTFGCQMNHSDSEKIKTVLENNDYKAVKEPKKADLIIVNMCSVRQSAVDRIYGLANKFAKWKKENNIKTILTGCILKPDLKKFEKRFDLVFNIKNLPELPKLIFKKGIKTNRDPLNYLKIKPKRDSSVTSFIPIMSGCNNFCSYCVVPYTRGREFSRPGNQILKEIKKAIENNSKEIILLGQNVNSYKDKEINFPKLLKKITNLNNDFWLNFISSHPKDFSDELIKVMIQSNKITNYLHLAVQSGDNNTLKAMNRNYTVEAYKNIIKKIKKGIPNISLSTDIIVGFPGETKAQFKNTVKLFKWAKFDMAYIAKYSPRKITAAAKLKDNIPLKEKKKREKILTKILKKTALENNKKLLNKKIRVLVTLKNKNKFFGKTKNNKKIQIAGKTKNLKVGQFINCKVLKVTPWHLRGKLI